MTSSDQDGCLSNPGLAHALAGEELEKERVRLNRLAQRAVLVASAFHEIKNPLANLFMQLDFAERELLGGQAALPPERAQQLKRILDDMREHTQMIETVIGDAVPLSNRLEPVDLPSTLVSAIRAVRAQASSQVNVLTDLDAVPPVSAQQARLRQVFVQLLLNATQTASTAGQHRQTIRVVAKNLGHDRVLAIVSDTGPGIPKRLQQTIFEPFFTTRPGAVGLGLSVCAHLVQQMQGELWVESEFGRGARFGVELNSAAKTDVRRSEVAREEAGGRDSFRVAAPAVRIYSDGAK